MSYYARPDRAPRSLMRQQAMRQEAMRQQAMQVTAAHARSTITWRCKGA